MAGQQRKCANCRFYSDAGMPGNGWCKHPKRQLSSGMKILVRGGELACRNSWGGDLFQSRADDTPLQPDADLPGGIDEVTSVTIPQTRQAEVEDRVVADRPAPQRPLSDPNAAAHRDQDERARIMARGSRDALAHARQRYSSRHRTASDPDVVANDNTAPVAGDESDRVVTRQARFSDRFLAPTGPSDMRTDPVPREEVDRRSLVPRDRFDTVPEIDPEFSLDAPVIADATASAPEPVEVEEPRDEVAQTAYEHVLLRARRIRAAKQERLRPIRHADLLIDRDQAEPTEEQWVAAAPPPSVYDTAPVGDMPEWDPEIEDEPLVAEAAADPAYEESWSDEPWQDESWDDADDPVASPTPRRTWFSRLGFGQRSRAMTYDDADVTRHVAARSGWDEETPDDDAFSWEESAPPREEWTGEPWSDVAASEDAPARAAGSWLGAPAREDDLPAWRAAEPRPAPAVRRADSPPVRREPAAVPAPRDRAAAPPRQRQGKHGGIELPDLDDALFDATVDRTASAARFEPPVASAPREPARTAAQVLQSRSPRDSAFRASRFQQPVEPEPQPRFIERDIYAPNPAGDVEAELPDLDAEQIDVRDAVARGDEQVARRIETAPGVPRQCRTCRSFRSADGGTRGWCTNEHAFTHRRMVNDDDLACESSIGCWWLPADEWRIDIDDETDASPTPRMDALIARNRPAARRAAGE